MPLGLSLYVDGLVDSRLSSCCEYKYNQRLIIGKSGHFKVIKVEGGKECYRCQANSSMRKKCNKEPSYSNAVEKQTDSPQTRKIKVCHAQCVFVYMYMYCITCTGCN